MCNRETETQKKRENERERKKEREIHKSRFTLSRMLACCVSAVTFFKNASTRLDASAGAVQKRSVREQSRHQGEGKIKNMRRESDREGGGKERWGRERDRGGGKRRGQK